MPDSSFGRRPNPAFLATDAARSANTEFMEAIVAACVVLSCADGEIAQAERRRFITLARSEPRLATFSFEELSEEFAAHATTFAMDPELGRELAIEKIAPFRKRRREAYIIVETCRQLIPADGVAHPAEYRALAKLRDVLGLDPEGGAPALLSRPPRRPAGAMQALAAS